MQRKTLHKGLVIKLLTDYSNIPTGTRCYQDRTTQPHLGPCLHYPGFLFLVALGCLRLDFRNFVNRRSCGIH
jgi:hypothetical protein